MQKVAKFAPMTRRMHIRVHHIRKPRNTYFLASATVWMVMHGGREVVCKVLEIQVKNAKHAPFVTGCLSHLLQTARLCRKRV
jgi:hypothetical protein